KVNVLNKLDFQEAFKTVIKAFVGSEEYRLYESDSQLEIVDTGSKIEKIYWDENITIKEDFISVDELIFDNTNDISRYLLFGTLEDLETYEIKTGDDIKSISYNNMLSTEEFLIVNPKYTSKHVLLIPGERVNIGLIKPLVTVTAELHVVEDLVYRFETEYVDDKDAHYGTQKTIQEGSDGITRVTEKVLYKNGEIQNMIIIKNLSKEIKPVINKIISRGTKSYSGSGFQHYSGSTWVWPTVNPCLITSKFAPRWGSFHNGIDISGPGFGSPIYSSTEGKVISIYDSCPSSGDGLKDNCGGGYGNNVKVLTSDGNHTIIYAHLIKGARVKVGDTVKRNQIIGGMGNSGRSSGTHLHYEIINNKTGSRENPCSRFNC
ncbi:MAG: peptidoglycan DD-metalloendopeptidase family protein, partial [Bacilli bacterium]|nr:peptidoglycan DD-metalloendopeptidase family protein [Bacilli bacterium]